ncbi:Uncharacterised protein [Legionella lansingensis]|uniref:Macro domain-containing protein n=1 Tax=Legionella lansingensis TaxID=45067 RepID=A0A0W0VRN2_9GAMM|nr:hypothetical protein [Legionella lansingensis]KTD22753.1 hypothetical protein Llan_1104 [Legionella lansingensis]SNV56888.1 Uncharacterised protein [Legionella lansingensis]
MPVQTQSYTIPAKSRSLIVCAGTVTCRNVSEMGSGFTVFKTYFNQHKHVNGKGTWEDALNGLLAKFHRIEQEMPSYVRLAEQDGYIGGVGTVPVRGAKGLTFKEFSNDKEREQAFIGQYKKAVRDAIADAKELQRPLYIQPLGIGVYGWDPELAATLFAETIRDADPNNEVDITIPIFGENSKRFEAALHQALKTSAS